MEDQGPYNYQKSWSVKKPSSESHQWSYQRACESAQSDIEQRWGVDYRITQIRFADNGRTTKTSTSGGARTWRCTHTVTAHYSIEKRGDLRLLANEKTVTEEMKVTYEMLNEFHKTFQENSETEEIYETES